MVEYKEITDSDATYIPQAQARDIVNRAMAASAQGGMDNQTQIFMSRLDRFGHNSFMPNRESSGVTFITRPSLNLSDASLRRSRMHMPLLTGNVNSLALGIRFALDQDLARVNEDKAFMSKFYNHYSPFLDPLCNGMVSCSGWPDPFIETYTSDPGYHNEDQTIVAGGDNMHRTYDLTFTFQDMQYSPILTIFMMWLEYMRKVAKGEMPAYLYQINQQIINYTVSIYRFVLDPSRRFITRYARALGCFPKMIPYGSIMAVNPGEQYVNTISDFSIQFTVNDVKYDDYAIIDDFNRMMRNYCPGIGSPNNPPRRPTPENNFVGLPYVVHKRHGIELEYRAPAPDLIADIPLSLDPTISNIA